MFVSHSEHTRDLKKIWAEGPKIFLGWRKMTTFSKNLNDQTVHVAVGVELLSFLATQIMGFALALFRKEKDLK